MSKRPRETPGKYFLVHVKPSTTDRMKLMFIMPQSVEDYDIIDRTLATLEKDQSKSTRNRKLRAITTIAGDMHSVDQGREVYPGQLLTEAKEMIRRVYGDDAYDALCHAEYVHGEDSRTYEEINKHTTSACTVKLFLFA